MPALAGSGSGSDGVQMLLSAPGTPLEPSLQKPSSPPMSPMPGTEQMLPDGAAGVAGVTAEVSRIVPGATARCTGAVAALAAAGDGPWDEPEICAARAGPPSSAAARPAASRAPSLGRRRSRTIGGAPGRRVSG